MKSLTWSYSVGDFEDAKELHTPLTDGWGITSDGTYLIVGDSSEVLTRQVAVTGAPAGRQGRRLGGGVRPAPCPGGQVGHQPARLGPGGLLGESW